MYFSRYTYICVSLNIISIMVYLSQILTCDNCSLDKILQYIYIYIYIYIYMNFANKKSVIGIHLKVRGFENPYKLRGSTYAPSRANRKNKIAEWLIFVNSILREILGVMWEIQVEVGNGHQWKMPNRINRMVMGCSRTDVGHFKNTFLFSFYCYSYLHIKMK